MFQNFIVFTNEELRFQKVATLKNKQHDLLVFV